MFSLDTNQPTTQTDADAQLAELVGKLLAGAEGLDSDVFDADDEIYPVLLMTIRGRVGRFGFPDHEDPADLLVILPALIGLHGASAAAVIGFTEVDRFNLVSQERTTERRLVVAGACGGDALMLSADDDGDAGVGERVWYPAVHATGTLVEVLADAVKGGRSR